MPAASDADFHGDGEIMTSPVAREAILLVGGQGTRLRPLTETTPKPMLRVAGTPLTVHQIARARQFGVTRIILATSYRAEVFATGIGDGTALGVTVEYAHEVTALGTGGAIRNAAARLRAAPADPILVFNGDVLSGVDIGAVVAAWSRQAADVALYLTRVADPRAYGLVPTDDSGVVRGFVEKPTTPAEVVTDQINAGMYVFRRGIIDEIPPDEVVSVERQTFPALLAAGRRVIGVVDDGYWLDLGTPAAFIRGSADLVRGRVPSPVLLGPPGSSLVLPGAVVDRRARVDGGSVIESGARVGAQAHISGSVIASGATIGAGCIIEDSAVGDDVVIGAGACVRASVLAAGARIAEGTRLTEARVWPGQSQPGEPGSSPPV